MGPFAWAMVLLAPAVVVMGVLASLLARKSRRRPADYPPPTGDSRFAEHSTRDCTSFSSLVGRTVEGYQIGELLAEGRSGCVYAVVESPQASGEPSKEDSAEFVMKVFAGEQASGLAAKESEALAQILVAPKPEKRVELDSVGHSSAGVIMEKIRGPRLDGVLQRPVGSPSIPELWMALAEGIANIHAAGWVHGDISTRNAFLCEEPSRRQLPGYPSSATHTNGAEANNHCIRLIDFATGRKLSDDKDPGGVSDSQASRRVLGTPYFMAPEVVLGGIAQQASDVYSMGCIIHEFVTGRHLFDGATSIEICWRQANTPVCLPSQEELRRSGLTLDHGRLLEQILEKRPASRPTIDQVVERLKAIESK